MIIRTQKYNTNYFQIHFQGLTEKIILDIQYLSLMVKGMDDILDPAITHLTPQILDFDELGTIFEAKTQELGKC